MTAIAGTVSFDGRNGVSAACARLLASQRVFGASGLAECDKQNVGCAGPQPHARNFREDGLVIAADCRLTGEQGAHSDPLEFVREAYAADGPAGLDRLRGSFAIAIIDSRARRVTLARDISGTKALFYSKRDGMLAFASMPGALARLFDLNPDLACLARFMTGSEHEETSSYWEGVRNIEPGTAEVHDCLAVTRLDLFHPFECRSSTSKWPELSDELRQLLDSSVRHSLDDAGSIAAAHLSSGFDSNAVVSSAAAQMAGEIDIHAFTAIPNPSLANLVDRHRFPDEGPLAARAAETYAIPHRCIPDNTRIIPSIRGMARYFHAPVPNPVNFGWSLALGHAAAEVGASVSLRAALGNASISFGGLPVLSEWIRTSHWKTWAREALAAERAGEARWRGILVNSFAPWISKSVLDRLYWFGQALPPYRSSAFVRPETSPLEPKEGRANNLSGIRRAMIRNYDLGSWNHGFRALTGVEERDATGDRDLMEFCLGLPPEALLRDGIAKPLFRDAMRNRIPPFILNAPKRGFQGADFFGRINRDECFEAIEDFSNCGSANEIIDMERLRKEVANWPEFDQGSFGTLFSHVRHVTNAISVGLFLSETENHAFD